MTNEAFNGSQALHLAPWSSIEFYPSVIAGGSYTLTLWTKGAASNPRNFDLYMTRFFFYDSVGNLLHDWYHVDEVLANYWQRIYNIAAPYEATHAVLKIHPMEVDVTVLIDDISLVGPVVNTE